jgi:hypothetical protein
MKTNKELDNLDDDDVFDYLNNYKFNDPELDNIKDFDYHAKELLIRREITKQDYLMIEQCRSYVNDKSKELTKRGKRTLKEVFEGL